MAKQITSLYIDDTSLRLLVTRGDRPKVWGNAALKPGLIDGMVVNDPGKVADAVTGLLKEQKVNPGKMIVGISAEQVLIRQVVLPLLPKSILPEAVIREARRLLPLPPEELYLSWQVINTDEDKYYIFLMAFRRNSVDSILKALKIAKIKTVALTIKPLAHLVKDEAAVIIDTQQADFDIIVQMNGTPHLIRTLPFSDRYLLPGRKNPPLSLMKSTGRYNFTPRIILINRFQVDYRCSFPETSPTNLNYVRN